MSPALRSAAVAAVATLGLGLLWRLAYPASALAAIFPLAAAAISLAVGYGAARDRHLAFRTAWLVPGTGLDRLLTGRVRAGLAGLAAAVAGLPLGYFVVTAGGAELLAAALAVPLLAVAHRWLHRRAAAVLRPAFVAPAATALLMLTAGPGLVALFMWLGYAVLPRPGFLAEPTLQAALVAELARQPPHLAAEPVKLARIAEVTLWWHMDLTRYRSGWLTFAFLCRNALVALALIRVTADISTATARRLDREPGP